ncbi:MAG: hypothetical protein IPG88_22915 [Gemmatimonadetes bacterium]|nr:hypothetical protein [Gemmatimonadota bacterium]
MSEGIENAFELILDLVRNYVLTDLAGERGAIKDFDDTLDLDANVSSKDVSNCRKFMTNCRMHHAARGVRIA